MKRIFLKSLLLIIFFPSLVSAKNEINIICDKNTLTYNETTECTIYANDFEYIITNISGQIEISNNLEIVNSTYNNNNWLVLDDEFNVKDINLISENKKEEKDLIIAKFTIKQKTNENNTSKITFKEVIVGDENYESHEIKVNEFELNLNYRCSMSKIIILCLILVVLMLILIIKNKRSKKIALVLVLATIILPNMVYASNDAKITCNKTQLKKGEEVSCNLSLNNLNFIPTDITAIVEVGSNLTITSSNYDQNIWLSLDSSFNVNDLNLIRKSTDKISSINVATFKIKANNTAEGSSYVSVKNILVGDENYKGTTFLNKKLNISFSSSINTLKELSIDGVKLDLSNNKTTFDKTIDGEKVKIKATATDSKAKISGTGEKTLKYGLNKLNVIVTAEDGSKKTYVINITRKDDRNTNNYLKSLTLSSGEISFKKDKTTYDVTVDSNIEKITIDAVLEDNKASFVKNYGPRTVNLEYGNNVVLIQTLSENEVERVYKLNITRKDNRSNNTSIKSIKVNGESLTINPEKTEYIYKVNKNVEEITINVETKDPSSKIEITEPEKIEFGENIYSIKITSENGSEKLYTLIVDKTELTEVNNEETKKTENNSKCINKCFNKYIGISSLILNIILITLILYLLTKKKKSNLNKSSKKK